ncbi:hypothetical protein LIER_11672 [Lithospermum erythrorhizon]|uniref:Uncharacterized protein n=1 Tax=Lithospermum erythrorhizon TaxID=34254 RepID=A0AAV3PPD4_LITER
MHKKEPIEKSSGQLLQKSTQVLLLPSSPAAFMAGEEAEPPPPALEGGRANSLNLNQFVLKSASIPISNPIIPPSNPHAPPPTKAREYHIGILHVPHPTNPSPKPAMSQTIALPFNPNVPHVNSQVPPPNSTAGGSNRLSQTIYNANPNMCQDIPPPHISKAEATNLVVSPAPYHNAASPKAVMSQNTILSRSLNTILSHDISQTPVHQAPPINTTSSNIPSTKNSHATKPGVGSHATLPGGPLQSLAQVPVEISSKPHTTFLQNLHIMQSEININPPKLSYAQAAPLALRRTHLWSHMIAPTSTNFVMFLCTRVSLVSS